VTDRDDAGPADATRRTRLANERTYLAWWRTGLTALAVSIGFGKIVPGVSDVARWPFTIAGVGFALAGTAIIGYGHYRYSAVERALDRGQFWRADPRALAIISASGVALGVLTVVLVLATK
jgi:putative membrane protein